MKNPITRITTCLALSLVIVNISYGQTDNMQAAFRALASYSDQGNMQLLTVPAANNWISRKMQVLALQSGSGSNAVDKLVQSVRESSPGTVAVTGEDAAITSATVLAAFKQIKEMHLVTQTKLVLVGPTDEEQTLKDAAKDAGMVFEIVPLP
jgi:hypothetical protein